MLFYLILTRFCPIAAIGFLKTKRQMKIAVLSVVACYGLSLLAAAGKIIVEKKWLAILYIPFSMFPHYVCYGFAMWILMRCIWHCWSERVWKRIHFVSLITILSGVFAERYINAKVLQIFFGIFK